MSKSFRYDIVISHAFEDQGQIANDLNSRLKKLGYEIWYSGSDMLVGDDLVQTILHKVIPQSKYGVVIISRNFFESDWGKRELAMLRDIESEEGRNIILPIWHNVDEDEVKKEFPFLAARFAAHSSSGLDHVIKKLRQKLGPSGKGQRRRIIGLIILVVLLVCGIVWYRSCGPSSEIPEELQIAMVKKRVARLDEQTQVYLASLKATGAGNTTKDEIQSLHAAFIQPGKRCHRNIYVWFDYPKHSSAYQLEALGMPTGEQALYSAFGMDSFICFIKNKDSSNWSFTFINQSPLKYKIVSSSVSGNHGYVTTRYTNFLRTVEVNLNRTETEGCYRWFAQFHGAGPLEKFEFENTDGKWILTGKSPLVE